jgi:MoaA/NifB/PqqE/SkfB family radical SAM enzyme
MQRSIIDREIVVQHYPVNLDILLDGKCNLGCPHCFQKTPGQYIQKLETAYFKDELLEFLKYATMVCLCGGEPTICQEYNMLIDLIRKADGARILIMTNGHFVIQKIIPNIDIFDGISISVDAIDAETYHMVRPAKDEHYNWDRLYANIKRLLKTPRECFIDYSFLINGYNYKQIPDMIRWSKDHGVNTILLSEVFNMKYNVNEQRQKQLDFIYNYPEQVLPLVDKAVQLAGDLNVNLIYQFSSIGRVGTTF